jgi:hypothetical protein
LIFCGRQPVPFAVVALDYSIEITRLHFFMQFGVFVAAVVTAVQFHPD